MNVDGVIRTQLRDQTFGQEERGARCWRSAELVGDGWFVVEHCLASEGVREVRQWIATSINECTRLTSVVLRGISSPDSSSVRCCSM